MDLYHALMRFQDIVDCVGIEARTAITVPGTPVELLSNGRDHLHFKGINDTVECEVIVPLRILYIRPDRENHSHTVRANLGTYDVSTLLYVLNFAQLAPNYQVNVYGGGKLPLRLFFLLPHGHVTIMLGTSTFVPSV